MKGRKSELRAEFKRRRAELDPGQHADWSQALTKVVLQSAVWERAGSVAAFVGVRGEPDTSGILEAALALGKTLVLPRVAGARIEFRAVDDLGDLVDGTFGLREPPPSAPLHDVADLGVMLVPGLAFTRAGGRLGFGAGHYDRALTSVRDVSRPVRIGLCFDAFLDAATIPMEAYDVPMHAVTTEKGLLSTERFGSPRR